MILPYDGRMLSFQHGGSRVSNLVGFNSNNDSEIQHYSEMVNGMR